MNKFLMAMSILGFAVNAHANCPKKLAGKYVSSVEYKGTIPLSTTVSASLGEFTKQ